jgi:hypothetical protein
MCDLLKLNPLSMIRRLFYLDPHRISHLNHKEAAQEVFHHHRRQEFRRQLAFLASKVVYVHQHQLNQQVEKSILYSITVRMPFEKNKYLKHTEKCQIVIFRCYSLGFDADSDTTGSNSKHRHCILLTHVSENNATLGY